MIVELDDKNLEEISEDEIRDAFDFINFTRPVPMRLINQQKVAEYLPHMTTLIKNGK